MVNIFYNRIVIRYFLLPFTLSLICLVYTVQAQIITEDTSSNKPFFEAKKFNSNAYVGFDATVTQIIKNKAAMNLGLSLNWVINHKYVVSAKYHGLTTPVNIQAKVEPNSGDSILLKHHFAGLGFSYILFSNKLFSFQPELTAGWGSITYTDKKYRKDFAVIIPAVYGVYNATKYFRLGIGLNYRITAGGSLNGLKDSDLSGIGGLVFFRIGTF